MHADTANNNTALSSLPQISTHLIVFYFIKTWDYLILLKLEYVNLKRVQNSMYLFQEYVQYESNIPKGINISVGCTYRILYVKRYESKVI